MAWIVTTFRIGAAFLLFLSWFAAAEPAVRPSRPKMDHRLELTQALERRWFDRDPLAVLFRLPD